MPASERALPAGRVRSDPSPALLYMVAAMPPLFWSGNFLIARLMRDQIPPIQMSFWRWALALVILLPFCAAAIRADWPRIRGNLPFLALLGAIGVTVFNCFVYEALHYTTVVNAALVNALLPVVTFLLAYLILKQTLSSRQVLGILVSFAGAAIVISRGDLSQFVTVTPNRGDLLVFIGMSFWALYTVLIRWRSAGLQPLAFLGVTVAFGTLFHIPCVVWEYPARGGFAMTAQSLGALLYVAIFPSILAYILWNRSVAALGPAKTGIFMHLLPMFSALLAVLFLGESLGIYHVVGFVIIVGGILLVTLPAKLARSPAP